MKTLALATAFVAAAGAASAFELGTTGVAIGATMDANYTTGANEFAIDFTPAATFSNWGIDFSASTTFDVMGLNNGDIFQGLDLDAGYTIGNTGLRAYGTVGTDADFNFGDFKMGVTFSF